MSREYDPSDLAFASWAWYPNEDRFIYHDEANDTHLKPSSVAQWLCWVHQHDRDAARLAWQRLCEGRNPIAIVFRVSSTSVTEHWVELRARTSLNEDGQLRCVHGVFTNVTEREKASQKIEKQLARLTHFASTAAHDLKEPLRTIASFGEILKDSASGRLTPMENDDLREMLDATGRLKNLLDSILGYSGLERHQPSKQKFEVRQAIDASLLNLTTLIREKGAQVQCVGDMPRMLGNFQQIVQLFQNLVSNAIHAYPSNAEPKVEISVEHGNRLLVRDWGPGMTPQELNKIREPFSRGTTSAHYEGTGLGLAICQRVAAMHSIEIEYSSEPGKGTTVALVPSACAQLSAA